MTELGPKGLPESWEPLQNPRQEENLGRLTRYATLSRSPCILGLRGPSSEKLKQGVLAQPPGQMWWGQTKAIVELPPLPRGGTEGLFPGLHETPLHWWFLTLMHGTIKGSTPTCTQRQPFCRDRVDLEHVGLWERN